MKKSNGIKSSLLIAGFALSVFAFVGCTVSVVTPSVTSLAISNSSSYGIEFVEWSGMGFNNPSAVYEPILGYYVDGIAPGYSVSRVVNPGSDYIYFQDPGNATNWRTYQVISVTSGESASFAFYDSTGGTARAIMTVTSSDGSVSSRSIQLAPVDTGVSRTKAAAAAAMKNLK